MIMSRLTLEEPEIEILTPEEEELTMLMEAIAPMYIDFLEADPIDEVEFVWNTPIMLI